jgi:hypothetical protein
MITVKVTYILRDGADRFLVIGRMERIWLQ